MLYLVMGVCGSGKSTLASLLAARIDAQFVDADDYHPAANKAKMAAGIGLTDADRAPWLAVLHQLLMETHQQQRSMVLACSALKQQYRQQLSQGLELKVLYLHAERELLLQRLRGRSGHFVGESLLDSQLATLEPPDPAQALWLDLRLSPQQLVKQIAV